MQAILVDGTTITCGGFKAIDSGVVLTEDAERGTAHGFVRYEQLRYILPDQAIHPAGEGATVPEPETGDGEVRAERDDVRPAPGAAGLTERDVESLEDGLERVEERINELLDWLPARSKEPSP